MALILVVDDTALGRMRVAKLLKAEGHTVIEASNGEEAVDAYERYRPKMVIMDITMPRMDGLSALLAIRRLDPSAKVTMLTAMAERNTAIQAVKLGAKDFVMKPYDSARLLSSVRRMLEGSTTNR